MRMKTSVTIMMSNNDNDDCDNYNDYYDENDFEWSENDDNSGCGVVIKSGDGDDVDDSDRLMEIDLMARVKVVMIFQNDWFCWKWGDWNGCSYCFDDDNGSDEDDEYDGSMMFIFPND